MYTIFKGNTDVDLCLEMLKTKLSLYDELLDINQLFYEIKLWKDMKNREFDENLDENQSFIWNLKIFFIDHNAKQFIPNLTFPLRIYLSFPFTSVTNERSFSCLKRLKTYLRSTMAQSRLSSLAIISIEKKLAKCTSIESVRDIFAKNHNRFKFTS